MTNVTGKNSGITTDETVVQELEDAQLEAATGGFSLSGVWDDVKDGVSDAAHEVEEHPIAALAIAAGAVTGIGAALDVAAVAGTEAASIMGVTTGDLVSGAVGKTASAIVSGMGVGGIVSGTVDAARKL